MSLPPRDDPRRNIVLARWLLWPAGAVLLPLGAFLLWLTYSSQFFTGTSRLILASVCTFAVFGPGLMYLLSAIFLNRQMWWAIRLGMWPALIDVAAAFCILLLGVLNLDPLTLILGTFSLTFFTSLAEILSRASYALESLPIDRRQGFEPVTVQPVEPIADPNGGPDVPVSHD